MLKIFKNFLNFCDKKDKKRFIWSLVISLINAIFESFKIGAIFVFITAGLNDQLGWQVSLITLGIMLASILGSFICRYYSTLLQTKGGYGACALKRIEIAEHMRYVPMGYFNENSIGQILSFTTNTLEFLENLATRAVLLVSSSILTAFIIALVILGFDWRMGLIVIAGLMIFMLVTAVLFKKSAQIAPLKINSEEELVNQIVEYIEGINEVKSYKLVGNKCKKLNDAINKNTDANIKMEIGYTPYIALQAIVIKIIGASMIIASIAFYLAGWMQLNIALIMIISSFIIFSTLEGTSGFTSLLRNIDMCVDRAQSILQAPQMTLDGSKEDPINHDIEVKHVSFSYGEKKIIDDVSFNIKENSCTAIVGPSGGGKTTLTNLISRFFDIDEGEILLGGKNIKSYNYDTLMKNFSFVFQKVYLFKDTIANNIRFGKPKASMEEVIEIAKKAKCHDFISKLPNGYDTIIGEDGVNLSGGERQRISIARAMMKDSPIIVLDEATANVDPENEKDIVDAIESLTKDKTIIMIAHRLKTVRNADQILVIENGKITQKGTHNELIKQDGLYKTFIKGREKAVTWKI